MLVWCVGLLGIQAAICATPGFSIKASNVRISGQGTATSQFTVKSVNGYAGQVGVICNGPSPGLTGNLILPQCANPAVVVSLPANGSATGSVSFYPPTGVAALRPDGRSGGRGSGVPLAATLAGAAGLFGLKWRRKPRCFRSFLMGATGLGLLSCVAGCVGNGGLAMTPGTYTYTLAGTSDTLPVSSASTTITVTVACNSCP